MASSPITQVSQTSVPTHASLQPQLLTRLHLELRGRRFQVDRETIMNLPESVLLCLFPNGLVLSRQSAALSDGGGGGSTGGENEEEEEVYGVDVRNKLLFVLLSLTFHSLTQTVSNSCSTSSVPHLKHSTVQAPPQAYILHSNTSLKDNPRPNLPPRHHRIRYTVNKLL